MQRFSYPIWIVYIGIIRAKHACLVRFHLFRSFHSFIHFIYVQLSSVQVNAIRPTISDTDQNVWEIWIGKSGMNHFSQTNSVQLDEKKTTHIESTHSLLTFRKCNLFTMIHSHNRWLRNATIFLSSIENIATISNLINSIKRFAVIAPIISYYMLRYSYNCFAIAIIDLTVHLAFALAFSLAVWVMNSLNG